MPKELYSQLRIIVSNILDFPDILQHSVRVLVNNMIYEQEIPCGEYIVQLKLEQIQPPDRYPGGSKSKKEIQGLVLPIKTHPFDPSYTGMVCGRMVLRDGFGDECGLTSDHPVHNIKEPVEETDERTSRN